MQRVPADTGVMNLFNFIGILIAMAIVFFLVLQPFNAASSSPLCTGYIFAYLFCP
jgi:hypothetical protein